MTSFFFGHKKTSAQSGLCDDAVSLTGVVALRAALRAVALRHSRLRAVIEPPDLAGDQQHKRPTAPHEGPCGPLVPLTGLEPVLNRFRRILSPLCLPFHHSGVDYILSSIIAGVKSGGRRDLCDFAKRSHLPLAWFCV